MDLRNDSTTDSLRPKPAPDSQTIKKSWFADDRDDVDYSGCAVDADYSGAGAAEAWDKKFPNELGREPVRPQRGRDGGRTGGGGGGGGRGLHSSTSHLNLSRLYH